MAIKDKVIEIVANQFGMDKDVVKDDTRFEDLQVDDLDSVEILMECEDEFDISIEDDEFNKIETVNELSELIKSKGVAEDAFKWGN